jgi:arsenite methyltransferase
MGLRRRFLAASARQLGHPDGWRGRLVARALNRGNRSTIEAAVEASGASAGQQVADVGFGGGVGLRMLLDRVGPTGCVHGVDVSTTMVAQARRTYAAECVAGTLTLAVGSMLDLPLGDDSLDAAITVNTVYFLEDVDPALREFARVLRPGGRLVIGITDPDDMARMPVTTHGFRLRTVSDLLDAMSTAGFVETRSDRLPTGQVVRHLLVGEI